MDNPYRSLKAFAITFIAFEMLSLIVTPVAIAVRPELSLGSLGYNLLVGVACGAFLGLLSGIHQAMTASEPGSKIWYEYF